MLRTSPQLQRLPSFKIQVTIHVHTKSYPPPHPPTLIRHLRLKYSRIHLGCMYHSLLTVYLNQLSSTWLYILEGQKWCHISMLLSMSSLYVKSKHFWGGWSTDAENYLGCRPKGLINALHKTWGQTYTVRNDIPFVTAVGAELGTTGVGAATGRMVGDLLAENDWTTKGKKGQGRI